MATATDRDEKYRDMARRGKYRKLYTYLCYMHAHEWRASFSEIEAVLGFALPPSARLHRPWWANQRSGNGNSQSLAWSAAGWETAEVDMSAETLLLRRRERTEAGWRPSLDDIWPVHPTAVWPEGLSLRREDIYDYRM